MTEQNSAPDTPQSANPISMGWRVVLGVVALAIVVGLGWQLLGNKSQPAPSVETPAAEVNTPAPDDSPEGYFQRGNNYYKAGDLENAVTAFKQAVALNPKYVAAYANLGAVYYAQQKLDLAEETYLKAIELAPNDADIIYNLGAIYVQEALATNVVNQEKLALATEKIKRAIELKPDLAAPYYGLGVVNRASGNTEEAIKAFETFLDLDDGSDPIATTNATNILNELKTQQ